MTTIVLVVYNTLVHAPWRIRDAGAVVQVLVERGGPGRFRGFAWPEFRHLRDQATTFAGMTAFINTGVRVTDGDASWEAGGSAASENFFDVLGTGFAHGRGFSPSSEDLSHPEPEVVLHMRRGARGLAKIRPLLDAGSTCLGIGCRLLV